MDKKKTVLIPVLIIVIILFLLFFGSVIWAAARKPFVIKQLIKTDVSTVVKEILPASEYVCLVYNYQSIIQRTYNPGSWLNERNLLIVIDGTVKLGFDCSQIKIQEKAKQLLLTMPPVRILAHEQYPERAVSYELAGGGILRYSVKPQEILDLLGDSKLDQEKQVEENEDLIRQAREAAQALFKPLLELNPSIKGQYQIDFIWQ